MTTIQLLDANGAPLEPAADPLQERIAELERQLTEARATIQVLTGKIKQDEIDMLVSLAIGEGKMLPELRPWAVALGRRNYQALQAFIEAAPVVPGRAVGGAS